MVNVDINRVVISETDWDTLCARCIGDIMHIKSKIPVEFRNWKTVSLGISECGPKDECAVCNSAKSRQLGFFQSRYCSPANNQLSTSVSRLFRSAPSVFPFHPISRSSSCGLIFFLFHKCSPFFCVSFLSSPLILCEKNV